jgi:membrane protein
MPDALPRLHLMRAGIWERFWAILRGALIELYQTDCLSIAKGVAYSALLAFFPAVTTLATVLVQAKADAVARNIASFLYEVIPPGSEDVVRNLFIVRGERPNWLLGIATVLAAFAASGAIASLTQGFHALYRIPKGRSLVAERLVALALVFGGAAPVLGASALIVFGNRVERMINASLGNAEVTSWVGILGQLLRYSAAFGAVVLVTAVMYYFGPVRRQSFGRVFPGAVLATVLWLLTTIAFAWYVRNITNYNVLYGSVGAGLALLVWMYMLAVILLLGCAFNVVREAALKAQDLQNRKR